MDEVAKFTDEGLSRVRKALNGLETLAATDPLARSCRYAILATAGELLDHIARSALPFPVPADVVAPTPPQEAA